MTRHRAGSRSSTISTRRCTRNWAPSTTPSRPVPRRSTCAGSGSPRPSDRRPATPMTRPLTAPGRLVAGRYRLQSQIGGGGMGAVWLARDELLGRQVAVKQVISAPGVTPEQTDQQRQRALREGRIAARLSHAHAISVYDVALEAGQPWLVMEYLPSRSLAEVLNEDGVLRTDQVAQIGDQVADALAATHTAGIVHRDVKPANILLGE